MNEKKGATQAGAAQVRDTFILPQNSAGRGNFFQSKAEIRRRFPDYLAMTGHPDAARITGTRQHFRCLHPENHKHGDATPSAHWGSDSREAVVCPCGTSLDIFAYIAEQQGLDCKRDFHQIYRIACEVLGYDWLTELPPSSPALSPEEKAEKKRLWRENGGKSIPRTVKPAQPIPEPPAQPAKKEKPLPPLDDLFQRAREALPGSAGENYLAGRGISLATAQALGVGFVPEHRCRGQKWQAVIFPTSHCTFTARNINGTGSNRHDFAPMGSHRRPWGADLLAEDSAAPVVIVEGEIDRLSVHEAGGRAIASGGAARALLVDTIAGAAPRPYIIIADRDQPGKNGKRHGLEHAQKLQHDLAARGVFATLSTLGDLPGMEPPGDGEPKDMNDLLQQAKEQGTLDELRQRVKDEASRARDEWEAWKQEQAKQEAPAASVEAAADTIRAIIAEPTPEKILSRETAAALVAIEHAEPVLFHEFRTTCQRQKISLKQVNAMIKEARQEAARAKAPERREAMQEREELTFTSILPGAPEGLRVPLYYSIRKDGKVSRWELVDDGSAGMEPQFIDVTATAVVVSAYIDHADTANIERRYRLAVYEGGRWQSFTCDGEVIASKTKILALKSCRVDVSSATAGELVGFLQEMENCNRGAIKRIISFNRTGWHEAAPNFIFPGREGENFLLEVNDKDFSQRYKQQGTQEEWLKTATAYRKEYGLIRLSLAASLAAPLLKRMGNRGLVIHIWGDSGHGKTAAMKMGASVWGDPTTLVPSMKATDVGAEQTAAQNCDIATFFDDVNKLRHGNKLLTAEELREFVMNVADGNGKTRGSFNGRQGVGKAHTAYWRTVCQTTGEQPITQRSTNAGTFNRLVQISLSAITWKELPRQVIKHLHRLQTFGTFAGRVLDFIEAPENDTTLRNLCGDLQAEVEKLAEGHTDGQADNLTAIAVGDGLFELLTGKTEPQAVESALSFVGEVIPLLESSAEVDEGQRGAQWVSGWLACNQASHFTLQKKEAGEQGILHATREEWGFTEDDGAHWHINAEVFRDAMDRAGFPYAKFIAKFAKMGLLEAFTSSSKTIYTKQRRRNGARAYYYTWTGEGRPTDD